MSEINPDFAQTILKVPDLKFEVQNSEVFEKKKGKMEKYRFCIWFHTSPVSY